MKKVVFLDQRLGGGGAEKVMCTVMRALNPEKYEIHLVITKQIDDLGHLVPDWVVVHELGLNSTKDALWAFAKLMRQIRPAIVFSSITRCLILAIVARLLAPGYKVIGRYPTMPSKEINEGFLKGWRLSMTKFLLKKVDCLVAQTKEMKLDIEMVFGLDPQTLTTINNPIDVRYMEECVAGEVSPFETNTIPILGVGTLYPVKGFDTLIYAFSEFLKTEPRARLHLVGKDYQGGQAELEALAAELAITNFVTYHGFQKNPYRFLKFCSLFVLSSRREGMPNVLLEAQYFNLPVVATRCVPIIDELVQDGENGYRCDVEDAKGMTGAIESSLKIVTAKNDRPSTLEQFVSLF